MELIRSSDAWRETVVDSAPESTTVSHQASEVSWNRSSVGLHIIYMHLGIYNVCELLIY